MTSVDALAPLTAVVGEEEFLRARAVADVVAAARAHDPGCDVADVAAGGLRPSDLPELLTPGLFAGTRVVVLQELNQAVKELAAPLAAYCADPTEGVCLVVVHPGGARGKAVLDAVVSAGARVVQCPKPKGADERIGFVRKEVARNSGAITPEAARVLLDAVGTDLRELAAACSQLVADSGGRIDTETVRRYHRGRADVSGFAVADRAVVGDGPGALEALRWALSVGVAHVLVADALADGVRTIARVSSAGRADPYALAGQLGMPPWKVRRAREQARGWSEAGLRHALGVVARVNAEVKGAAADPSYALEVAVGGVADARQTR